MRKVEDPLIHLRELDAHLEQLIGLPTSLPDQQWASHQPNEPHS